MEKKHPPPFSRGLHSNPAGYLGKGFRNYKHSNNVASSIHWFFAKCGIIEILRKMQCNTVLYSKYNKLTNANIPCPLVCLDLVHQDPP
uniref:Uncharacterized protein n=1 Tax=Arundo donax TaxID=35708 RepID=A0A0A9GB09_ARUDO